MVTSGHATGLEKTLLYIFLLYSIFPEKSGSEHTNFAFGAAQVKENNFQNFTYFAYHILCILHSLHIVQ